ncbi:MAG TPA: DUF2079 domain-containing protein, partial [Candidatus Limnocylindrales bacterium]|nr:DUF2079 domain-containing protein [Candidatus Limnocylindrales bacterium]
ADASVAAENNLTPHLSQRRRIYGLEYEAFSNADYLALDFAALHRDPVAFEHQVDAYIALGYRVIARQTGLALLERAG